MTTSMVTDGMYVVAEHVEAGSTYYYRGMNLIGYTSEENIGYYRFNAHGDVVAVADVAGKVITEYEYDPFGKLEDDENEWLKILFGIYVEDSNPFRYCAEYYDSETEFIYLRARYYSPDLQRFISEDPIRDGNNWYAYCGNNAVKFIDPLGFANIPDVQEMWRSIISVFSPKQLDDVSDNESSIIMIDSSGVIDEKNEPLPQKVTKLDNSGLNMIANFERGKSEIESDENGNIILIPKTNTDVGYGHDYKTNPLSYEAKDLSSSEALDLLKADVKQFEEGVSKLEADLTQDQFNALVSLRYNIGFLSNIDGLIEYLENNETYDRETLKSIINGYYDKIINKNPNNEKFRKGWYNRTEKMLDIFFNGDYGDMPIDAVNGKVRL